MQKGDIYRSEIIKLTVAAIDHLFTGDPVPDGKVVRIDTIMVMDLTTANKVLRLGRRKGSTNFWIEVKSAGSNNYSIRLDTPIYMVDGERPLGQVDSATLNDNLYFLAEGVYL